MVAKDLYSILGLNKEASTQEIKRAYRKLARDYHPDRNPNQPKAEARFKEISAAFEVLGNKEKKALYDEFGPDGLRKGFDPDMACRWGTGADFQNGGGVHRQQKKAEHLIQLSLFTDNRYDPLTQSALKLDSFAPSEIFRIYNGSQGILPVLWSRVPWPNVETEICDFMNNMQDSQSQVPKLLDLYYTVNQKTLNTLLNQGWIIRQLEPNGESFTALLQLPQNTLDWNHQFLHFMRV